MVRRMEILPTLSLIRTHMEPTSLALFRWIASQTATSLAQTVSACTVGRVAVAPASPPICPAKFSRQTLELISATIPQRMVLSLQSVLSSVCAIMSKNDDTMPFYN